MKTLQLNLNHSTYAYNGKIDVEPKKYLKNQTSTRAWICKGKLGQLPKPPLKKGPQIENKQLIIDKTQIHFLCFEI